MPMQINKIIDEMQELKTAVEALNGEYEKRRQILIKHFDKLLDQTSIETDKNIASMVKKLYVEYDAEKLEERLDKKLVKDIIKKMINITDYEDFVVLLKQHGIKPAEFKRFIEVKRIVDKARIKQLFNEGTLTLKDLNGCYTANVTKSIIIKPKINVQVEIEESGGADNC